MCLRCLIKDARPPTEDVCGGSEQFHGRKKRIKKFSFHVFSTVKFLFVVKAGCYETFVKQVHSCWFPVGRENEMEEVDERGEGRRNECR